MKLSKRITGTAMAARLRAGKAEVQRIQREKQRRARAIWWGKGRLGAVQRLC